MGINFAKVKANARRVLHKTLGVPAKYIDKGLSEPVDITARLHTSYVEYGDVDYQAYGERLDAIEKVVLSNEDDTLYTFEKGAHIYFPDYGLTVSLSERLKSDGPYHQTWLVIRKP